MHHLDQPELHDEIEDPAEPPGLLSGELPGFACLDVDADHGDGLLCSSEALPRNDEVDLALPEADVDPEELDALLDKPSKGKRTRRKAQDIPVVQLPPGPITFYDALKAYDLLKKLTDIVLAKVSVPWHLRADATQAVHTYWAERKADPRFARNQLAHYAFKAGQHAALKLRRDIGAVVVIPGALFRTGRDSAFMESIGAAVNPRDVDDFKDSRELAIMPEDDYSRAVVTPGMLRERLSGITLNARQRKVAERALLKRMSADAIAAELQMQESQVERMLNQVALKLANKDAKAEGRSPSPAKVTKPRATPGGRPRGRKPRVPKDSGHAAAVAC